MSPMDAHPPLTGSKRPASRSPEGNASSRKFSRNPPTGSKDGASTPLAHDHSRPTSVVGSSRSTPQPPPIRTDKAVMAVPTISEAELHLHDHTYDQKVPEVMKDMVAHVHTAASLRVSRQVSESRQKTAQREYDKMQRHFQKYPAIKEKATKNRNEADLEMSRLDELIEASDQAGQLIATSFWQELSNSMNEKIGSLAGDFATQASTQMQTRFVPRDRFDRLEAQHELLLRRLQHQQESIDTMQKDRANFDAKTLLMSLAREEGFMSRAEYDNMRKQCTDLEDDVKQQRTQGAELQRQLFDIKEVLDTSVTGKAGDSLTIEQITGQVSDLHSRINRVEPSIQSMQTRMEGVTKSVKTAQDTATAASNVAKSTATLAEKVPALETRLKVADESVAKLQEYNNKVLKLEAAVQAVKEVADLDARRLKALDKDLKEEVKASSERFNDVSREVTKLKVNSRASPGLSTPSSPVRDLSAKNKVSDLARTLDGVSADLAKIKSELGALQAVIHGTGGEVRNGDINIMGLSRRLVRLEDNAKGIDEDIREEGKASIFKRLKEHDQMINNLWNNVMTGDDTPVLTRLRRLEDDLRKVKQDVRDQAGHASVAPSVTGRDSPGQQLQQEASDSQNVGLSKRIQALETELQTLNDLADPRDEMLQGFVEDRVNAVIQQLSTLDATLNGRLRADKVDLEALATRMSTWQEKLNACPKSSDVEFLKAEFRNLASRVEALQNREVAAPAPALQTGPQQFKPLSARASHAVQSPQAGTPQVNGNGIGPPPFGGALSNGVSSAGQGLLQEIANLKNQHAALAGHFNSLKHRADNLCTDDVVKAMCSQMSEMYPAAKDFQTAVDKLVAKDHSLEQRLNSVSTISNGSAQGLTELKRDFASAKGVTDELRQNIDATKANSSTLQQSVAALANKITALEGRTATTAPQKESGVDKATLSNLEDQIKDLDWYKEHLTEVGDCVRAFQSHGTVDKKSLDDLRNAFDKARADLDKLLMERDEFESSLLGINTKLESIDDVLESTDGRLGVVDETLEAQQGQIGVCQSQIKSLEETLEE